MLTCCETLGILNLDFSPQRKCDVFTSMHTYLFELQATVVQAVNNSSVNVKELTKLFPAEFLHVVEAVADDGLCPEDSAGVLLCADGGAQTQDGHALLQRLQHHHRLLAAHPVRHHHVLSVHLCSDKHNNSCSTASDTYLS